MSRRKETDRLKGRKDALGFTVFIIWGLGLVVLPFLGIAQLSEHRTLGIIMLATFGLFIVIPIFIRKKSVKRRLLMEEEERRRHTAYQDVYCGEFGNLTFSHDDRRMGCVLESERPRIFPWDNGYDLVYQSESVSGERLGSVLGQIAHRSREIITYAVDHCRNRHPELEFIEVFKPKLVAVPHEGPLLAEIEGECTDGNTKVWVIISVTREGCEFMLDEDEE
ncbi:hypothetical protein SAMN02910317_00250 [Ruminococcaceae bacterium FB2012]|nr:hypothetical protein SAMN02910317_00250 [Ruminococcaceae bacterium FB2012]